MQTAIGRFSSRAEAEMARSLLASADIDAYIRADDAGAMHPELAQVGEKHGIALMVDAADAADAQELLDEVARGTFADPAFDEGAPDPTVPSVGSDGGSASGRTRRTKRFVLVVAVLVLAAYVASLIGPETVTVFP